MGKDSAVEAVRRFRDALSATGVHPQRVVMFGSHAMDQARRDSDIDVVVVSADFCGRGLLERIDMMVPAICEVRAPIEAVAVTPEEWETRERLIVTFADNGVEV